MSTEIQNLWRIVQVSETSILELRAILPKEVTGMRSSIIKHFRAPTYSSIDDCRAAFEAEALRLNGLGYNVYVVMNPIREDFIGPSAKDSDISRRSVLLIDIDRAVKQDAPATDAEVAAAGALADEVKDFHAAHGWGEPIRVMSGNGHHLYYLVDGFPNTDASKSATQKWLGALANKFDNSVVTIDRVVFNASRITKVVGTVARKGEESEGRPYRMARML
jgi:hypothetical protein